MKFRDLGLSYFEAGHGVQSAVRFEMSRQGYPDDDALQGGKVSQMLKHLRVGLDMRAADTSALAQLMIDKGVFTEDEYIEHMRLAANEELARYEQHIRDEYDLPEGAKFR
jgi:hypothetical protein